MERRDSESTHSGPHVEEGVLASPVGRDLPRTLDPVITMAAVQRYVESERGRSRRLFVWTSTVFLFLILVILTAFISIGIFVLRNSRAATEIVADVQAQAATSSAEVAGLTNRLSRLDAKQVVIDRSLSDKQARDEGRDAKLKAELRRFGQWASVDSSRGTRALASLGARVRQMEATAAARQLELAAMREQQAALLASVASGTFSVRGAGADTSSAQAETGPSVAAAALPEAEGSSDDEALSVEEPEPSWGEARGEISVATFPNGDRYEGEFLNGFFHGWGIYTYRNGDRYEGQFRNDAKNGRGTYTYNNGDRYVGEFSDDMRAGRGSSFFANGDRYAGEFQNDMIDGKGSMLYANGNKYAGDFKRGLKNGNGTFRFGNGDVYTGEFCDDLRHGKGKYVFADGARYVGEFQEGRRHGKGRYIYPGGEEFVGEFRDGRKNGVGDCIYPNGKRLRGIWKDDEFLRVLDG